MSLVHGSRLLNLNNYSTPAADTYGRHQNEEITSTSSLLENNTFFGWNGNVSGESTSIPASSATSTQAGDVADKEWNNVGWKSFKFVTGEMDFELPLLFTVVLCGIIGNALVMTVYLQKKYRKSNAALYIMNLAIGDLFLLLIVVVFHITEFFPQTWPYLWRHDAQCWLHRFGRFIGFNSTIFTSVAIAYDRFQAVVFPLQFKSKCTAGRTIRIIIVVWIAAVLAAIPNAWNFRAKYSENEFYENYSGKSPFACWVLDLGKTFNDFKIIYTSIVLFFVPAIITLVIYVVIIGFMWRNNCKMQTLMAVGKARRNHWKTARMLLIAFLAYVSCYVLFATYTLVQQLFLYKFKPIVKNIGLLIPYANSCMNPIVYSLINDKFRKAVWEIITFPIYGKKGNSDKNRKVIFNNKHIRDNNKGVGSTCTPAPAPRDCVLTVSGQLKSTNVSDQNGLGSTSSRDMNTLRDCDDEKQIN